MCLAIPGKIIIKKGDKSLVDFNGIKKEVISVLVNARAGDYVLVHAGVAIQKLNKQDAWEALKIYDEAGKF